MSVPDSVAAQVLAKCGRRCCICRRFAPLHLQINHIVKREEGGTDDPDNLILVCVTCHADIHTKTELTRRFTGQELKLHRDALYELVAKGVLPTPETADYGPILKAVLSNLAQSGVDDELKLSPKAIEILLKAATDEQGGEVYDLFEGAGRTTRAFAEVHAAIEELAHHELLTYSAGKVYLVTHKGYVVADEILSRQAH